MYLRIFVPVAAITLTATLLHAAETAVKPDQALVTAASLMRQKNYSSASRAAGEAVESGRRDLLQGVAELKKGNASAAAPLLGRAARGYPLLADYALYYQTQALMKMEKTAEALETSRVLLNEYPESPLARKNLLLQGDLLFSAADFRGADAVYQKFVEKYASGSDALQASYRSALCREKLGDSGGAAAMLRVIWLSSPASAQAARAEEDLDRLGRLGAAIPPFTPQELLKRGTSLYDQRRYDQALKTFRSIDAREEKKEFGDRLTLKICHCLLKSRRYGEAENALKELVAREPRREIKSEASHLLARAVEKGGRDEEAFIAYSRVAELFPESGEADNALLDAAFIRKFQRKPDEAAAMLARLLETYPATSLKHRAAWELGWSSYLAGNHAVAAEQFRKLAASDEYRERALYWLGKSLLAAGDLAGAKEALETVASEFPFGFYTLQLSPDSGEKRHDLLPKLAGEPLETLPRPEGYERVKALISLGMIEDASRELSASRKKNNKGKSDAPLARLYLEMGNYNGAMTLFNGANLKKNGPETRIAWSLLYPKAYADLVNRYSSENSLSPGLAYAVMRSESSFNPGATSPVGARGLMQLMPNTAAQMLKEKGLQAERLYDPELNIRLGTRHLKDLLQQYNGNLVAVIASYNAGGHNVNRWLKTYSGLATDEFIESIPFGETRDYVKKVLATAALYRKLYDME